MPASTPEGGARPRAWLRYAPVTLATATLAAVTTRAIADRTGGLPGVPLDDTYIHFQYARALAELHPLVYSPGAAPAAGATSLLWPLVLAPFYAAGLRGQSLIFASWALGWISLGLLAWDTSALARKLTSRAAAIAAGAMVLAFGGYAWCAASGMEVVPFAWLLVRSARRAAEWLEEGAPAEPALRRRRRAELLALGVATPMMRPEGVIGALLVSAALATRARGRARAWALAPWAGVLAAPLVNLALTGQSTSTTALVKWLPLSPYHHGAELWRAIGKNVELLFVTLLDGEAWSASVLPTGGRVFAWLALPALLAAGARRHRRARAACALAVALGMLVPATYDSFLWNRLRYLWPFAAGWFVGLAALADLAGELLRSLRLPDARAVIAGGFVGALGGHLHYAIDDVAVSSDAIRRQQVALGEWARDALPAGARIGVNDTGAIAYYSGRPVFDICGLTTAHEARYWAAGAGSRFEHYERLERDRLPTHFIVYPAWMALPPLLGERLTERTVTGATILGGVTMVAAVADYSALRSGARPLRAGFEGAPLDELDVADLESEAAHDYELFWASQAENFLAGDGLGHYDGARSRRTLDRFALTLAPSGRLLARLGASDGTSLSVRVDGREVGTLEARSAEWQELALTLPPDLPAGRHRLEVEPRAGATVATLHYWSFPAGH